MSIKGGQKGLTGKAAWEYGTSINPDLKEVTRLQKEYEKSKKKSPAKMKENFGTGDKKTERKLNRINRKMQKQHAKQDRNEDKGTKRGDRRADKAHAKGRKLLAKGRAVKKASDERTANLKEVGPPKESPAKKRGLWDNIHAKRSANRKGYQRITITC